MNTFDRQYIKGKQEGREEGREEAKEAMEFKVIKTAILDFPFLSDLQIAKLADTSIELVKKIRKQLEI